MASRRLAHLAFGFWAVLSIGLLGQYLYDVSALTASAPEAVARGEIGVKLGWGLLILNFPASLLVASLGSLVPTGPFSGSIADWCVLSLAGLIQWAVVVPSLLEWFLYRRRLRKRS